MREALAQLFWLAATLQFVLSFWLVMRLRRIEPGRRAFVHTTVAFGQRKDSWLAAALVWAVIGCSDGPIRTALMVLSELVLVWLCRRTVDRLRIVRGAA